MELRGIKLAMVWSSSDYMLIGQETRETGHFFSRTSFMNGIMYVMAEVLEKHKDYSYHAATEMHLKFITGR